MQSASTQGVTTRSSSSGLRTITIIILLLLATQFMIGMIVNLFVKVPDSHPGALAPEYFSGVAQGVAWALLHAPVGLLIHVLVGLLLFLASLVLLICSIVYRRKAWIIIAVVGLLGIVLAGLNGASFMNYGHDFSSLLMSIGFVQAAVAYTFGVALRVRS